MCQCVANRPIWKQFTNPLLMHHTACLSGQADLHPKLQLEFDWPCIGNSQANPMPFTRTICLDNLGTSALYGMVPGLLGGWFHSSAIQSGNCQLQSNWHKIGHALARIGKSHANPGHSEDNCVYNQGTSALYGMVPSLLGGRNLRHSIRSAPIQGHSLAQSRINLILFLPIQANPVPIRRQSYASPRSTMRSNIH